MWLFERLNNGLTELRAGIRGKQKLDLTRERFLAQARWVRRAIYGESFDCRLFAEELYNIEKLESLDWMSCFVAPWQTLDFRSSLSILLSESRAIKKNCYKFTKGTNTPIYTRIAKLISPATLIYNPLLSPSCVSPLTPSLFFPSLFRIPARLAVSTRAHTPQRRWN